jgi:hypothetical protein
MLWQPSLLLGRPRASVEAIKAEPEGPWVQSARLTVRVLVLAWKAKGTIRCSGDWEARPGESFAQ